MVDNDPRILAALQRMQTVYSGMTTVEVAAVVLRTDRDDAVEDVRKLTESALDGLTEANDNGDPLDEAVIAAVFCLALGEQLGRGEPS